MSTLLWICFLLYGGWCSLAFFILILMNHEGFRTEDETRLVKLNTAELIIIALISPIFILAGLVLGAKAGDTVIQFFIGKK